MLSSKLLKAAGVDAINIPDGPRAGARMGAILTAVMIEQQVGIETVLHYTCMIVPLRYAIRHVGGLCHWTRNINGR